MPFFYRSYADFLKLYFPDVKVQKLAVDAGFSCPNRDGRLGTGGCTFCDNRAFHPTYGDPAADIVSQLCAGKAFFGRRYPRMCYLAYFQAYTNTYATLDDLKRRYEAALSVDGVVGLIIGTRPDCVPDVLLRYLQVLSQRVFVMIEYGIESANDDTLRHIHRGHTFAVAADAVRRTADHGLPVGAHIILGLPGENHGELMRQSALINALPLSVLKLHQLQLIDGTPMAREFQKAPDGTFPRLTADEYIDLLIDYIERLRPDFYLERFVSQSPGAMLIAPRWGLKPYQFMERMERRMSDRHAFQGRLYNAADL